MDSDTPPAYNVTAESYFTAGNAWPFDFCSRSFAVAIPFVGLFLLLTTAAPEPCAQGLRVDGIVRDASGATISGIEVKLRCQAFTSSRVTDSAGVFEPDTMWSR